jgi:hypothetical protein
MSSAAKLATELDEIMLGKAIYARMSDIASLPERTGADVYAELKGRPLLRYIPLEQVHEADSGRNLLETFVTPTPAAVEDLTRYFAIPRPDLSRGYVIKLDPREIDVIKGPRWVNSGQGIEYILPNGFRPEAVMSPGWST